MSDVAERVKKIVVEHLGVDADKVVENANFIDDLGADSLDTVELVMAFEEEFGVEIPELILPARACCFLWRSYERYGARAGFVRPLPYQGARLARRI